jgi:urease accessory protein
MGRCAAGRLSFERAGDRTVARSVYAESPLRLLTPRSRGAGAMVFTSTFGGGLLDGDQLRLQLEVAEGARAGLFSQGPTRVFRSPGGVLSELTAGVSDEAALVLAPDPVACFAGARFEQRTSVELAPGASLVLQEVLSAGRDGFRFARYLSGISVRREGKPLIDEALLLDQAHGPVAARLGRFKALATLVVVGPQFRELRESAQVKAGGEPLRRDAPLVQTASPLGDDAVVLRLAGETVEAVLRALRGHLSGIPAFLGNDPWRRDAPLAA